MDTATLVVGTYAIATALTQSEGPYGALYKIRTNKKIDDFGLLNCFLCTAFWVALLSCAIVGRMDLFFIAWGSAVIIDKVVK